MSRKPNLLGLCNSIFIFEESLKVYFKASNINDLHVKFKISSHYELNVFKWALHHTRNIHFIIYKKRKATSFKWVFQNCLLLIWYWSIDYAPKLYSSTSGTDLLWHYIPGSWLLWHHYHPTGSPLRVVLYQIHLCSYIVTNFAHRSYSVNMARMDMWMSAFLYLARPEEKHIFWCQK